MNKYEEMYKNLPREELLEILKERKADMEQLKIELKRLDKYTQYSESAAELKVIYDSFVEAGFSEDQAFQLLMNYISAGSGR